jgi:oligopeptide transport system substrate-binding protein
VVALLVAAAGTAALLSLTSSPGTSAATRDDVILLVGEPTSLDPATQGDAASAAVSAQLFESVTAIDPSLEVRPALARDWEVLDGGMRVVFHLRGGLRFSDGSPLTADDVVRSWLRLVDPDSPSPLASLLLDIEGAAARSRGEIEANQVGLRANGSDVEVRLTRLSPEFPAIVAGPSFGVVARNADGGASAFEPGELVSSGAYRLVAQSGTGLDLEANEHYWAGTPAIAKVRLVTDLGGRSAVDAFEAGDLDYGGISSFDAAWIAYDAKLGPQLRDVPSLSVEYYGFDTTKPPFDDPKVRQAFGAAVDWRRIVQLATPNEAVPATSIVPGGIPDRTDRDFLPAHDPEAAKRLLAEAGYPGGSGFPDVALVTGGSSYDDAFLAEIHDVLGITLRYETMEFGPYFERLTSDPPAIWSIIWVADYPGQNDFLGVLLGEGQSNNYGGWRSDEFEAATRAGDYETAQEIVGRDVPVVPMSYSLGWALSRDGLLGATQNGLGIVRIAGLAWTE